MVDEGRKLSTPEEVCMGISRRLFLVGLAAAASVEAYAAEGDFFKELISGISDRSERDFFERHRDDGRWDGQYYYDRHNNKRYTRDEWSREMRWRYKGRSRLASRTLGQRLG